MVIPGREVLPVTVYVPCYNAEQHIAGCLEALAGQDYPIAQVLVIDDGSTDRTVAVAKRDGVGIIRHPGNWGLAEARNTGMRCAATEFVAAVDADAYPDPQWLSALMRNFTHAAVAGVGGKLLERFRAKPADRWRAMHMQQHFGEARLVNPLHLFGANTVFRKSCIDFVGGYPHDRQYRTNNEDYYISRRLRGAGFALIYEPQALCRHQRRDTWDSLFQTYFRWFFLHRPRPESQRGLLAKYRDNLRVMRGLVATDIAWRNPASLPADLMFFYQQCAHDLRHYGGFLRARLRG